MISYLPAADPGARLDRDRRSRERDQLAAGRPVDVLVVGGGVTGTGVALDAASRGLSVALIESNDLANGTSRWSSKLVHGGLRYLAGGHVAVAWESASERAILAQRVAPHLIRPMPQLVPILDDTPTGDSLTIWAGLRAGNIMRMASGVPGSLIPRPRHIGAAEAVRLAPCLPAARLRGALLAWDGQLEDDARLVVAIARTAAAYGAHILTRCEAKSIGTGGAVVEDRLDGGTFEIKAGTVVNATGVWAGSLDPRITLRPSRGSHVIVRAHALGHPTAAVTVQVPDRRGRYVFALPQPDDLIYIGLTDEPAEPTSPEVSPRAPEDDIDWIVRVISLGLDRPIHRDQVVGSYAGLRPLVDSSSDGKTADISREHTVLGQAGDVITVTGGKLTTYRRMAEDAVSKLTDTECRTRDLPLIGAGPVRTGAGIPSRLVRRYGCEAGAVAALADQDPHLLQPLAPGVPVLGVELRWAQQHEGALTIEDLVERRTRIALVPEDLAAALPAVRAIAGAGADLDAPRASPNRAAAR